MPEPYEEPEGYSVQAGFVKSNPLNNDYYLSQYEDWEEYPALLLAHEALSAEFPGYNIRQIKMKFNDIRYYVDGGTCKWWNQKLAQRILYDILYKEVE